MHRHSYQELFDEEWLYFYFGYKAIKWNMAVFVLWLRRVVLHLYFGHRDIWWSMVTMYFSYEVWLQFTLVTKHGFSYLSFRANWWSMTTVYFDHRAIWWNITTVNLSYIAIWWSMATFVRLLHSYLMRYGYNVLFVTKLFDKVWLHLYYVNRAI